MSWSPALGIRVTSAVFQAKGKVSISKVALIIDVNDDKIAGKQSLITWIRKVFSKLDLRWGYHQLELTPDLREITFVTHCGLFRYKRLLLGVNSASEQYQHEIPTALARIDGQENISDDNYNSAWQRSS